MDDSHLNYITKYFKNTSGEYKVVNKKISYYVHLYGT
jgi:hypothetical protein